MTICYFTEQIRKEYDSNFLRDMPLNKRIYVKPPRPKTQARPNLKIHMKMFVKHCVLSGKSKGPVQTTTTSYQQKR